MLSSTILFLVCLTFVVLVRSDLTNECPYRFNCTTIVNSTKPDCTSRDIYDTISNSTTGQLSKWIGAFYAPIVTDTNQNSWYYATGNAEADTTCVRTELLRFVCANRNETNTWKDVNYVLSKIPEDPYLSPEQVTKGLSVDQLRVYKSELLRMRANDSMLIAADC